VRCSVEPFRQFLLPFDDFTLEPNNYIMVIRLAINRNLAERGAFDLHHRILQICILLQRATVRRLEAGRSLGKVEVTG
jgi:hypothetical protein